MIKKLLLLLFLLGSVSSYAMDIDTSGVQGTDWILTTGSSEPVDTAK